MTTQAPKEFEVGGHKLAWQVRHWPMWTGDDGLKGMSIEVVPVEIEGRRLFLEFPPPSVHTHRMEPGRSRPRVSSKEVATFVEGALAAGWSPASRGKPFVHRVEAPNKSLERTRDE
jgi:hypothetical protein